MSSDIIVISGLGLRIGADRTIGRLFFCALHGILIRIQAEPGQFDFRPPGSNFLIYCLFSFGLRRR
jgi:hypothetical protein